MQLSDSDNRMQLRVAKAAVSVVAALVVGGLGSCSSSESTSSKSIPLGCQRMSPGLKRLTDDLRVFAANPNSTDARDAALRDLGVVEGNYQDIRQHATTARDRQTTSLATGDIDKIRQGIVAWFNGDPNGGTKADRASIDLADLPAPDACSGQARAVPRSPSLRVSGRS